MNWPGYPSAEGRAEQQGSAFSFDDLPFTCHEADGIRRQLKTLLASRREPAELSSEHLFDQVRDAAMSFTARREHEAFPVRDRLDFRRRLRRLADHPRGLGRLLKSGELDDLLELGVQRACGLSRPPEDWRRRLQREPGLLPRVVEVLLADPFFIERGGGEPDDPMVDYVDRLAEIYEAASGKEVARSTSSDGSEVGGPAVRFMCACIKPFAPAITDQAIVGRIRRWRSQQDSKT